MSVAEHCKAAGLSGAQELSDITGVNLSTLYNWHDHKPKLFHTVVTGAKFLADDARKKNGKH